MATGGFTRVPNALIDHADLTAHELLVYIVLLRHADPKSGTCYPGLSTIADEARCSRETVKRIIPKLERRGVISVQRSYNVGTKTNQTNVYTVRKFKEDQREWWADSVKGRRRPKRAKGRHSETLPAEESAKGRHSETLGRHSETLGVGTPSASKKTQEKKTQEEAMRHTLASAREMNDVIAEEEDDNATDKQVAYLRDLAIIHGHEHGAGIPDDLTTARWRRLTRTEASDLIRNYWDEIDRGRSGNWSGITENDDAFAYLSATAQQWIIDGADPRELWSAA